jgi:hypothetical protein
MAKVNLSIDATTKVVKIEFLTNDSSGTVEGTHYFSFSDLRDESDGWIFNKMYGDQYNKKLYFAQIVNLNGSAIGATTHAAITALLLAAQDTTTGSGAVTIGGVAETPTKTTLSVSSTIAAGARSVTIITDSSFTGTILGDTADPLSMYSYSAQAGNTLGAIAIVRTAGSYTILKTV